MNDVVASHGWTLVDQIPVGKEKASHFNRKNGVSRKVEFEEVQVFERIGLER